MKILVTGGTVFVSRFTARYFVEKGHEVWVLNRNSRPQEAGVRLIEADRLALGEKLRGYSFDAVIDVACYCRADAESLLNALGDFGAYIMLSSSAVYPETLPQPFREDMPIGLNSVWGAYGEGKVEAEKYLRERVPDAYFVRPPYLYGPMENLCREPFVFDCAEKNLPFYLPGDGSMPLQFFHVRDLCRLFGLLLDKRPKRKIWNAGNPETVTSAEWIRLCYAACGKTPELIRTGTAENQRSYFCFNDYAYTLDVSAQTELLPSLTPLSEGLCEARQWHLEHPDDAARKPYLEWIGANLAHK